MLGAILVGLAAGLEREAIAAAVRDFTPLAHRLERIAERDGVTYVDDSKATNPGSVMAALRSFDRPIVLIAGGKAKGTEFADLGRVASSRTKAVVLIGEGRRRYRAHDQARVRAPGRFDGRGGCQSRVAGGTGAISCCFHRAVLHSICFVRPKIAANASPPRSMI